jgi:hypothetical protein
MKIKNENMGPEINVVSLSISNEVSKKNLNNYFNFACDDCTL